MAKNKRPLRSHLTYGRNDRDGFIHRSWMKGEGMLEDGLDGRPILFRNLLVTDTQK